MMVCLEGKFQSKKSKLCETNPISEESKMNLNLYSTRDYENKPRLRTPEKQTQSNPILSASPGGFDRQDAGQVRGEQKHLRNFSRLVKMAV